MNKLLLFLTTLFAISVLSCPSKDKNTSTSESASESTSQDTESIADQKRTSDYSDLQLDKAFIEPSPTYDILLNTKPDIAEEITNKENIIKNIKQNVNSEDVLYKYLEQKRQYAKSSIFSETP